MPNAPSPLEHRNVPDALWWSPTTVATVGYGDRYPVTRDGRLVAIGLMLAGIALIATVTAAIASWLVARVRDAESDTETDLTNHTMPSAKRLPTSKHSWQ